MLTATECLKTLTDTEFSFFSVLKEIGPIACTAEELSQSTGKSRRASQKILKKLREKRFIAYRSTRGVGYDIYWLRRSLEDDPVKFLQPIRLLDSKGGRRQIGDSITISSFCKKHGLEYWGIADLLSGRAKEHRGWRLAPW